MQRAQANTQTSEPQNQQEKGRLTCGRETEETTDQKDPVYRAHQPMLLANNHGALKIDRIKKENRRKQIQQYRERLQELPVRQEIRPDRSTGCLHDALGATTATLRLATLHTTIGHVQPIVRGFCASVAPHHLFSL